jgi:hypothetical protein
MYWPDVFHLAQPAWAIISKWTKTVKEADKLTRDSHTQGLFWHSKAQEVIQKGPKGQDLISGV